MGRPLYYLGVHVFELLNFKSTYQIDDATMRNFLRIIEAGYKSNPYHNSTHAADVMHSVYYFLFVLGLSDLVTPEVGFLS